MGIPESGARIGGWVVGPVVGRRPAGPVRDAVHPGSGARAVLVVVDGRFTDRLPPDAEAVARASLVGSATVPPMLDAGLLEDGTRWFVTPAPPGPVLDPAAGCSPRRAVTVAAGVARALDAVHRAGLVHGLVGAQSVVPAAGRHAERPVSTTLLLDTGLATLLGSRAADLAAASGVALPADRGPAADVYSLGALLLRLLTAAAPAGPALAALPVDLRELLSDLLDDEPSRRPSAAAAARRLTALQEGLLATGPVGLPLAGPAPRPGAEPARRTGPVPEPARRTGPVPEPARRTGPATAPGGHAAGHTAPDRRPPAVPVPAVPALATPVPAVPAPATPVPAASRPGSQERPSPVSLASLLSAPIRLPEPAPSMRTGPVAVPQRRRPARRRTVLLAAGGVGLAGLLVGVVTQLPPPQSVSAVAAAAQDGDPGMQPARSTASVAAGAADTRPVSSRSPGAPSGNAVAAPPAAFSTAPVPNGSPPRSTATGPTARGSGAVTRNPSRAAATGSSTVRSGTTRSPTMQSGTTRSSTTRAGTTPAARSSSAPPTRSTSSPPSVRTSPPAATGPTAATGAPVRTSTPGSTTPATAGSATPAGSAPAGSAPAGSAPAVPTLPTDPGAALQRLATVVPSAP